MIPPPSAPSASLFKDGDKAEVAPELPDENAEVPFVEVSTKMRNPLSTSPEGTESPTEKDYSKNFTLPNNF